MMSIEIDQKLSKRIKVLGKEVLKRKKSEKLLCIQRDIAIQLCSIRDLKKAINYTLEKILQVDEIDCGAIYKLYRHMEIFEISASMGLSSEFVKQTRRYKADIFNNRQILEGKPIYGLYADIVPVETGNQHPDNLLAAAFVPVMYAEKVIAIMFFASRVISSFPRIIYNFFETIASDLGSVLAHLDVEEELPDNKEILKTVFEITKDKFIYIDSDKTLLTINSKTTDLFGYTREEVVGKKFNDFDFLSAVEMKQCISIFDNAMKGQPIPLMEFETRSKTGSPVFLEVNSGLIRKGNEINGLLTILKDITARKLAEKALQKSEEKYRELVENINDVLYIVDKEGVFKYISPSVKTVAGYDPHTCIGKSFEKFVYEEDIPSLKRLLPDVLSGKVKSMEGRALKKNGETIWVRASITPVFNDDELVEVHGLFTDVTERHFAQEALRKHRDNLEEIVSQRTQNLEEANIALKVLLQRIEKDKDNLEEKIFTNIMQMIKPFMEKLISSNLNERQKAFAEVIESGLDEIVSSFTKNLTGQYYGLTPMEIQIANLIKQGKSTKEIADLFNLSPGTIKAHRNNIRKKLGIKNKKENLHTHLMSF